MTISFTSIMSSIADPLCVELVDYLTQTLDQPTSFLATDFSLREQAIHAQSVQVAWLCGLYHVRQKRQSTWPYTPLVAVCMLGESEPVYYGDIIVRADSHFQTLPDLRATRWAYNETGSFSGYEMMWPYLAAQGETLPFFGERLHSGAHLASINWVLQGQADCATIDSTVLQMLKQSQAETLNQLRVVARVGPHPMPPLVVLQAMPAPQQAQLRQALLSMHQNPIGQALLNRHQVARFVAVSDADYQSIATI